MCIILRYNHSASARKLSILQNQNLILGVGNPDLLKRYIAQCLTKL